MSQRLLHLSDLHLDRTFASMGCHSELARQRRDGLRDVLRRAGRLAHEQNCSAITLGGDIYEHERSGVTTAAFLADLFEEWELPVLIAPGNHDPLLPDSLWARIQWPANVHIFSEPRLRPVRLGEITVWGLAHMEPSWMGDPLAETDMPQDGVHVALFHGAEMGSRPADKAVHGPFHAADIRARGFCLALCGHYHRQRIDTVNGLIYPGTPEPLDFDDEGDRGPVVVDIDAAGHITATAVCLNRWRALTLTIDVSEATSARRLEELILTDCESQLSTGARERTLVRLELVGAVPAQLAIDGYTLERELREATGAALISLRDRTVPEHDIEAAADERSARGAFTRQALAAIEATDDDEERAVLEDALRYGLTALSGAEVGLR